MKKIIIFCVILFNIGITSICAQISIRKNNVVEKLVFKPKQFDSLSNITMQKNPIDYKKFIGYKLFFLPKSKNYKQKMSSGNNKEVFIDFLFSNDTVQITKEGKIPFEKLWSYQLYGDPTKLTGGALEQYNERKKNYENIVDKAKTNIYMPFFYHTSTSGATGEIFGTIATCPDSVYGRYFTIMDIKASDGSKEYKNLEDLELTDGGKYRLNLKITLKNESNQDILYWIVQESDLTGSTFFLVPYFEKQRNLYLDKNLVLRYSDRSNTYLEDLIDINTGSAINIKYGEVWTCSDISFIDSKDSYHLTCFYFLKNGDKEVKIELGRGLVKDYFMLESEFHKQELEKAKKEEEIKKEELEQTKRDQQEKIKLRNSCIAKWGPKMGGYIADGKVLLGMNKEMCIAAWGNPINVNRTIVRGLTHEQWVYGWGTYLYFENGALSGIQD